MVEAYKKPIYENEPIFVEETPVEQKWIPFTFEEEIKESKEKLLKQWKKSEGYYYLHPEKFNFSLRDL
ncbi:MAG: hypothetical protein EU532_14115 [Promethearchaeota archaeon]|nr:MAG: hypothetical protein EU532_14115 [Candidatus Lokiarchaeota archaeon]